MYQISLKAKIMLFMTVFAVVINVIEFAGIDKRTRHNYKALYLYEDVDLFKIAIARDNSARRYVAPYYLFGKIFPHATVIIPEKPVQSWFEVDLALMGLARVASLDTIDYNPEDLRSYLRGNELIAFQLGQNLPQNEKMYSVIKSRIRVYRADSTANVFLLSTPEGPPGREKVIDFIDMNLLNMDMIKNCQ